MLCKQATVKQNKAGVFVTLVKQNIKITSQVDIAISQKVIFILWPKLRNNDLQTFIKCSSLCIIGYFYY